MATARLTSTRAGGHDQVDVTPALDEAEATPGERAFGQLLVNTLVSGVTSSFLWFAGRDHDMDVRISRRASR